MNEQDSIITAKYIKENILKKALLQAEKHVLYIASKFDVNFSDLVNGLSETHKLRQCPHCTDCVIKLSLNDNKNNE